jgi:hypothetical protein
MRVFVHVPNGDGAPCKPLRTEVALEFSAATCYFWKMSDRVFAQTCPNCGGICPQQAETCKYCKFSFSSTNTFSLNRLVPRKSGLRIVVIVLAILVVVILLVINIFGS